MSQPERSVVPFKRIRSETRVFSGEQVKEAAQAHQSLPRSPTERELDPGRVHQLVERIKSGIFLPCSWSTVTYNGSTYRMNGQHSSQAVLEAAEHAPSELVVHFDHYQVSLREGMGVLFRQFDARFSGRSKQDVAGAYQGLVEELQGIRRDHAKLGIEGVGWYERAIEGLPTPSNDDLYTHFLAKKYHKFLRWLNGVLSIKTPELKRAPIVGAMYATFITSESGAQEFWSHTAKNDLNDDMDPRAVLSVELLAIKERKRDDTPTPAEFYAKCIKAWNAYRAGDKIKSLNVNTKKGLPDIAA